jgi:hypothetical protein
MRNAYIVLIATTLGFLFFLLGDYLAWFGTSKSTSLDYVQVNFKMVDEETGVPLMNSHVRCFQKKNRNACSEVNSGKAGILSVKIPIHRVITRSHIFKQGETMVETEDPELHIMFIHSDYASPVESIMTKDLPSLDGKQLTVTMPKRMGLSSPESDSESQE